MSAALALLLLGFRAAVMSWRLLLVILLIMFGAAVARYRKDRSQNLMEVFHAGLWSSFRWGSGCISGILDAMIPNRRVVGDLVDSELERYFQIHPDVLSGMLQGMDSKAISKLTENLFPHAEGVGGERELFQALRQRGINIPPGTAELRDAPLHGARHTAATAPLLGVPDRAVMGIMGWTKSEMLARYQHLTDAVRSDIAGRVGALLWDHTDKGEATPTRSATE